MASTKIDYEKAARVLVSVMELGGEKQAAAFHKVSERTVRNYKSRVDSDPELAAAFRKAASTAASSIAHAKAHAELGWRLESHATLRSMLAAEREVVERMRELAKQSVNIVDLGKILDKIARSAERIGKLDVASEALGVSAAVHQRGPTAAADAGGASGADDADDRDSD